MIHTLRRGEIHHARAEQVYPTIEAGSVSLAIIDAMGPTRVKMVGSLREQARPTHTAGATAMPENDSAPERWLPVADWPGYEVSTCGRVRSWKKSRQSPNDDLPRLLNTYTLPRGYHCIKLKDRGRKKSAYVHRLVLEAFVGPAPRSDMQAAHWNGDKSDNTLGNLRWATPAENARDSVRLGEVPCGEGHYAATISEATARAILNHPGSHAEAAREFGVGYSLARNIRARATWKHL
jgi:hypothetical protein